MVEFIVWSDDYKVNVKLLDGQHRVLMDKINDLNKAVSCNCGREDIENFLKKLLFYTVSHFEAEESLMLKHGYPEYNDHKAIHEELTNQVREFQKKFQDGGTDLIEDLLKFLKKWLEEHILVIDKKYGPFLNNKGVT